MIKRIFPKGILGEFGCVFTLNKIKRRAPLRPRPIPIDFIQVIFSFKKIADKMSNKTGASVITTELFIGVDKLSPLKNIVIFRAIPKKAQAIIRTQSRRSILSEGKNKLSNQNTEAAPRTRKRINPNGFITSGIKPLAMVWFAP